MPLPYNFATESFLTNKLCTRSRLSSRKAHFFNTANGKFSFLRPLWGLGATYAVHLRLTGKPVVDFLLVIIEHFSLRVKGDELYTTEYILDVAVFEWGGSL